MMSTKQQPPNQGVDVVKISRSLTRSNLTVQ